jgi:hypothetical protein
VEKEESKHGNSGKTLGRRLLPAQSGRHRRRHHPEVGGGSIKAEVAKIPQSTLHLIKNQIGNLTYEDFNIQCGLAMGAAFKDWVKASLDSAHIYKSGDIQQADFNRKVQQIASSRTPSSPRLASRPPTPPPRTSRTSR